MKKIIDYIKSNRHCLLLLYWPFHFLWYELLRILTADNDVLIIRSPLDAKIPFCEWFMVPYVFWYLYIAIVLIHALRSGKREFIRADLLISLSMLLPMIFCTIVPNGIDIALRPDFETLGRNNIATRIVQLIYLADSPPRNVMPSMHVSVSWALLFAILQSKPLKGKYLLKTAAGIMSVLISLSTVFIKQHSVLDVFAGIGTALLVFAIVFVAERIRDKKHKNRAEHCVCQED